MYNIGSEVYVYDRKSYNNSHVMYKGIIRGITEDKAWVEWINPEETDCLWEMKPVQLLSDLARHEGQKSNKVGYI